MIADVRPSAAAGRATGNLIGEFLRARRELVRPEERGLPDLGRRRVPGLRREEVAILAGISVEYYVRLERGRDRHPSTQVIEALARVLDLDADSTDYLTSLAAPRPRWAVPANARERAEPGIVRLLASMADVPAFVLGRFMDVLAHNRAAEVLHGGPPADGPGSGNIIRHLFLDGATRAIYPDWDDAAAEAVAALRASAAGFVDDPRLVVLVGELSLKSPEFRRLWARHEVRGKTSGTKRIVSPTVGPVTVTWETLAVTGAPGQLVVAYLAEPGDRASEAAMRAVAAQASDRAAVGRRT